tara:strand:- start:14812 stop:15048 length:237 start_codon:yes stop_codon:yes gene_type:complete
MYSNRQWSNFVESQQKNREADKQAHFKKWLNTNNNEQLLFSLLNQIDECIDNNGYTFKNKNEFKDELATFIYKLTWNA